MNPSAPHRPRAARPALPTLVCALALQACSGGSTPTPTTGEGADPGATGLTTDAGKSKPTDASVRVDAQSPSRSASVDGSSPSGRDAGPAQAVDVPTHDARGSDAGVLPSDAASAPAQPSASCGGTRNDQPFGCDFAWGTNDPTGDLGDLGQLSFLTKWVGYEIDKNAAFSSCDGCSWLTSRLTGQAALPVYYAYFIGYLGSKNGFADQNVNPNGPNLATDGAKLIRDHRAQIIGLYAAYAEQTARAWPDKPLVWLLEGDFAQYTYDNQKTPLSMTELGQLASDITCAIKGHMPHAVVAINHSTWLSDDVTNQFWEAMKDVPYDLVWTTGVANNSGFFEQDAKSDTYNSATATYAYVAKKTGRKILVDTSFGLSEMSDSWSSAPATALNARIADGVLAANVTKPQSDYVATAKNLTKQLQKVCQ